MKILAVFAHPDDESFGPAGTLAQASQNGHTIFLLTLTQGEFGTLGISKQFSRAELAQQRTKELKRAVKQLGIQHFYIHNFPDNNLKEIPSSNGIKIIKEKIKSFKPECVITYHENTISGHSDHRLVTDWTYNAIKCMENPPKLFYYGLNDVQTSIISFENLFPVQTEEITHIIDIEDYINTKISAIKCHKTQIATWEEIIENGVDPNVLLKWECFVQKWPMSEFNSIKYNLFEN